MSGYRETVLYYSPEKSSKERKVKGVLVRLGIHIRTISPDEIHERVGVLAGLEESGGPEKHAGDGTERDEALCIGEEMLVLHNFTGSRLDQLLRELRKSNASVDLKAVLTESNSSWSFYELYGELSKEHEQMKKMAEERRQKAGKQQ